MSSSPTAKASGQSITTANSSASSKNPLASASPERPSTDTTHPVTTTNSSNNNNSNTRAGDAEETQKPPQSQEQIASTAAVKPPQAAAASSAAAAWSIDFSGGGKPQRRTTRKEREALSDSRFRKSLRNAPGGAEALDHNRTGDHSASAAAAGAGLPARDSEGNEAHALPTVVLDGALADAAALVPRDLPTTRADLEARLVLRLPRLLCVNKQYPRSCGVSSLAAVHNYLYSRLGESDDPQLRARAPVSQEELMSVLGFEPPFGEIAWGGFTGNATLIRWFHALNRHYGLRGKAYILYKAHGAGRTSHLYEGPDAVLAEVKKVLRDPHCALIYHCHNHYMVPVGFQEIPRAQADFLRPRVPPESCDTTIFIGEVSRGRHEALYARKWSQIVTDIECASPQYYNIRRPELGVQTRQPGGGGKGKRGKANTTATINTTSVSGAAAAAVDTAGETQGTTTSGTVDGSAAASPVVTDTNPNTSDEGPNAPAAAPTTAPARKKGGNNLHCLICFRSDEAELHPERFEHPLPGEEEEEETMDDARPRNHDDGDANNSSGSSSSSDSAAASDVEDGSRVETNDRKKNKRPRLR